METMYQILDSNKNVINTVVADATFMAANYPNGNYVAYSHPVAPAITPPTTYQLVITGPTSGAAGATAQSFTATVQQNGATVTTFNQSFLVPIQDSIGNVIDVKNITFTNGAASVSMAFPNPGYYWIRQAEINAQGNPFNMSFPDFRYVAYQ